MILEDDDCCFVCGGKNPIGLKLNFELDKEKRVIKTEFIPSKVHQGYKDIIHGGIISTILDEAMVKLALGLGLKVVTRRIEIKFKNPLLVGERILVSASFHSEDRRLIEAEAKAMKDDGGIVAEGRSTLVVISYG